MLAYYNEGLLKFYSLPSIIRTIMSRRMEWAGYVAHGKEEECIYNIGKRARRKNGH
jgi:hypothetical protein